MQPQFQSSFIPKGSVASTAGIPQLPSLESEEKHSILGLIATIIFIIALALSAGAFGYAYYLHNQIEQMGSDLEAARTSLEPQVIKDITALNSRIISVKGLISNHVVISTLFDLLEKSTLQNVRFTDLAFESSGSGQNLTLKGQARGYSALALESDALNSSQYLKNIAFSNLALDDKGAVTFSVTANIDPGLLSYQKTVVSQVVTPSIVPVGATTTATSSKAVATTTATSTKPK